MDARIISTGTEIVIGGTYDFEDSLTGRTYRVIVEDIRRKRSWSDTGRRIEVRVIGSGATRLAYEFELSEP